MLPAEGLTVADLHEMACLRYLRAAFSGWDAGTAAMPREVAASAFEVFGSNVGDVGSGL